MGTLSILPKLLLRFWLHFLASSPYTRPRHTASDLLTSLLLALDTQAPHSTGKRSCIRRPGSRAVSAPSIPTAPSRALGTYSCSRPLSRVAGSLGRGMPEFPHRSSHKHLPPSPLVVPFPYLSLDSIPSLESLKVEQLKMKRHCILPLVFQKQKFSPIYANFSRLQTELG